MEGVPTEYTCCSCGELNETLVDPSAGSKQLYVEDCSVCCHPNVLSIVVEPSTGAISLDVHAEE